MSAPLLYRGYDKAELDRQYNNRQRFPHYTQSFKDWQAWSAATRANFVVEPDIAVDDFDVGEREARLRRFTFSSTAGTGSRWTRQTIASSPRAWFLTAS